LVGERVVGEFAVSVQQHEQRVDVDVRVHCEQHAVELLVAGEHLGDKVPGDAKVWPDFLEKEVRQTDSACAEEGTGDEEEVQIEAKAAVSVVPNC